jgi:hypothetical protein
MLLVESEKCRGLGRSPKRHRSTPKPDEPHVGLSPRARALGPAGTCAAVWTTLYCICVKPMRPLSAVLLTRELPERREQKMGR